jgi:hypothetical protein
MLRLVVTILGLGLLFGSPVLCADVERLAYVTVAGAPGDGERALTEALYKVLALRGMKRASPSDAHVYEIEGLVRVGPGKGGKDSVVINWIVFDPEGNTLGRVAQTREVRKGSLDKIWGRTAGDVAVAAIGEIMALVAGP